MNDDDRISQLEQEVAELRALLLHLKGEQVATVPPVATESAPPERTSRRTMLRLAGAGAVGAVAAATVAQRAAATDGLTLTPNVPTNTANLTQVNYTGSTAGGVAFLFNGGTLASGTSAEYPAVVGAWATQSEGKPTGLYGYTARTAGHGVVGWDDGLINTNGSGVLGRSTAGRAGEFQGHTDGVVATASAGRGGTFSGSTAALKVAGAGLVPGNRSDAHTRGEIDVDAAGDLWYCAAAGTPGTWRKLAGLQGAGAYHPLTPGRVYDSRRLALGLAPITAAGGPYSLAVSTRYNSVGGIVQPSFVPKRATAVTANITVTRTVGAGALTMNPLGVTAHDSATISWYAANQTLSNGATLKLGGDRQITVVCSGSATAGTHFIIDITGYYL